ncbi:MAG: hypothetical protein KDB24_15275, partial [Microthrixaceae bacterium]|nr:hypothetical protein [Microthrixaceae bacterium]
PTSILPKASLGLGISALAFSERWRPKRTERVRLERSDAVQTSMVCELDIDEALAICTTTRVRKEIWLPLFRLRPGTSSPGHVTDERGKRLPVMSVEEVAGHIAAGVAQVLLSDVLRSAIFLPIGVDPEDPTFEEARAHRRTSQTT